MARALLSPGSAEDRSSLFVWFIDTMARSDSSSACVSAVWLCTFADRPRPPFGPRRSRGLPVLVHVVSQRARVLRLRRTVCSLAINAIQPCCLPLIRRESASWFCVFRSSIARPTDTPVYASSNISRCLLQDSGPRWSRCLLSCRTLSFLSWVEDWRETPKVQPIRGSPFPLGVPH